MIQKKKYSPTIPRHIQESMELFIDNFDVMNEDGPDNTMWEVYDGPLEEAGPSGLVDGKCVLGRAIGPFFLIDSSSRNKRFYSRRLWEKALGSCQDKIRAGRMLGTIGHEQALDDEAIREGKPSHKVTRLWIDEGKKMGMGELLILNTPAGQNLNTYLRAGVQLPVSSRGYGQYTGQKHEGCEVVDPDNFHLETFDFVQSPGVMTAIPVIVENTVEEKDRFEGHSSLAKVEQQEIITEAVLKEETPEQQRKVLPMETMSEKYVETLQRDKIFAETRLEESVKSVGNLETTVGALKSTNEAMAREIEAYRQLGTPEAITEVFQRANEMVEAKKVEIAEALAINERMERYAELGTPEEIQQVMEQATSLAEVYEMLGAPQDVAAALESSYEMLKSYKKLGAPQDIKAAFKLTEEVMEEMQELGSLDDIRKVFDVMENYVQIGTPDEIREAFVASATFANTVQGKYMERQAHELSEKFGVKYEVVAKMMESLPLETIEETLTSMAEAFGGVKRQTQTIETRYDAQKNPVKGNKLTESMNKSRAQRLNESFAGATGTGSYNVQVDGEPITETAKEMRTTRAGRLFGNLKLDKPIVNAR